MKGYNFETAQHLCGLIARFFDDIAECSPEFGEDIYPTAADFKNMCRDFTHDPAELGAILVVADKVGELAGKVLEMAE